MRNQIKQTKRIARGGRNNPTGLSLPQPSPVVRNYGGAGMKAKTQEYLARRDMADPKRKGKFWFGGSTRKLTDEQAKPYLANGSIRISDKQILENILHPTPKINGIDILHRHVGRRIFFEAWKGDDAYNNKMISFERAYILTWEGRNFYDDNINILSELVEDKKDK